ncbi:MAG TPA: HAMP domain-containing sensor histidine kinase [Anaeromyxobacter sp.]|nr:HAMP domain-containing sensor histidine kinase [Anaeromyxobacter sp.]
MDIDRDLDQAVVAGVADVRYRNGVIFAWLRVGLRTLTLATWLLSLRLGSPREQVLHHLIVLVNVAHLAIGCGVLMALRRRRVVHAALLLAAAVDILVVAFAGWLCEPGDVASAAFLMGVMQLMLLFSGLTLPRAETAVLGAIGTGWQLYLGLRLGLRADWVASTVLVTGASAVAITWAGTRIMELAARRATGDYTGQLLRTHRDALASANREIASQRDRVLAAQAEAETLSKLVVHDLRNPLAALQQFVSLARERLGDAERAPSADELSAAREDLELAAEEGGRLAEMIGDLLLISRLESTALQPSRKPTPTRSLLEGVGRGIARQAADRQATVTVASPAGLTASLDSELARRLLENLAANALRFVDRGGRIELAAELSDGSLVLAVRNTGPTVPPDVRPQLFQKHSGGAERSAHNLGLGLYLCRLVAEAHGGTMALGEAPGFATSFEARLPLEV